MRKIVCSGDTCFGKPRLEGTRVYIACLAGLSRHEVEENYLLRLTDEEWALIQAWLESPEGRRAVNAYEDEDEA